MFQRLMLLWFLPLALNAEAGLREGELNPDLTNPGAVEHPAWFKTSFLDIGEDIAEARADGRRLLLYFYQDGCPYCKKLLTVNFQQPAIVRRTRETLDVLAINMWGDREVTWLDGETLSEKDFARKMRVMFTPTLLFLDEQGKVALRVNGYYPPEKFHAALDYVAQHREGRERFADFYRRQQAGAEAGPLRNETFFRPLSELAKPSASGYRLVLFEQARCAACAELHEDILQRPESREWLRRYAVFQVDMWADTPLLTPDGQRLSARDWAGRLDIKYTPSLVFFDASGREVFRTEAYLKAFHLQSALEYVASGAYREQPEFQRYIDQRAEHLRERGIEVDLMR